MARQNRREIFDPNEVSVMHCISRGFGERCFVALTTFQGNRTGRVKGFRYIKASEQFPENES